MSMFVISTIFFLAALVILTWLHTQAWLDIDTPHVTPPAGGPLISVIVPARNEEKNIRRCVESILAQDYPNFEVLVLDDHSTDSTPAILTKLSTHNPRLVILAGRELPAGWAGKPHALYQAAKAATGDWLLFVDADTFLAPNALSATLAAARQSGAGLYTVMTEQILGSFWEKTVMPLVFTALSVGFSPRKVNDPRTKDAIANGQFIFIRREIYDAIGGHQAVRNQIVEDKAISERVKWGGHRLIVADGRGIAKTRMYTGLPSIWEGWTKNIYLGLADQPAMLLLGAFGAFLALIAALFMPIWPLLGWIWWQNGGGWMALTISAEALIVWAVLLYARVRVNWGMGLSGWYALTTPLGAGVFAAMMFTSTWKVLSGQGVTWKGRKYDPKVIR
jgi:chlorobactene glucosyltransferase